MRTSFHHQPEAQHPHSPAIYTPAGRLPHLFPKSGQTRARVECPLSADSGLTHRSKQHMQKDRLAAVFPKSAEPD